MTELEAIDVVSKAVHIALVVTMVMILPGLIVGFIVAVFQAATQINEVSLNFVPKLFATFVALIFTAPWLLKMLTEYAQEVFSSLSFLIS